jgi:hypothetical protein
MMPLDPEEQGTGKVNADADLRMFFEEREEGVVRVLVTILEDVVEITGGLVSVNDQEQVKR